MAVNATAAAPLSAASVEEKLKGNWKAESKSNWEAERQKEWKENAQLGARAVGKKRVGGPVVRGAAAGGVVREKEESLVSSLCTLICEHQIGLSINLLLLLTLVHACFPRARRRTSKFFHLSYYNEDSGKYGLGKDDLPIVLLWVVLFTAIRASIMDYILHPLARAGGIMRRKDGVRFAEQAWLMIYCTCFWSLGMYIMYHSEYWNNLEGMWNWPDREVSGLFKWYYLVQFAFWLQQILVVNIEEKRKDYAQMFFHHIITCVLIFMSYGDYHLRIGNVILCIMDIADIVLAAAKILKYLGYKTAPDIIFGLFVVSWVVARHGFFLLVCRSIYNYNVNGCHLADGSFIPMSSPAYDALGPSATSTASNLLRVYTDREGPVCWNPSIKWSFLGLLLTLQGIMCLWFAMIMRVVFKVLSGKAADDVRSDDEEEVDEKLVEDGDVEMNGSSAPLDKRAQEEVVGVEDLTFSCRSRPGSNGVPQRGYGKGGRGSKSSRGGSGRTSGISIPGHGDHKELLGRIGCDKPA